LDGNIVSFHLIVNHPQPKKEHI